MAGLRDTIAAVVALEHVWFFVLESFLWTKPIGLRTFRQSAERAEATRTLAANQGVYNGFLAAGLVWGLLAAPGAHRESILVFFLSCVVVAGIAGAVTVSRRILMVQALPAALALLLTLLVRAA
jgi:putative membrane protein